MSWDETLNHYPKLSKESYKIRDEGMVETGITEIIPFITIMITSSNTTKIIPFMISTVIMLTNLS